jgi:hypothetical protein
MGAKSVKSLESDDWSTREKWGNDEEENFMASLNAEVQFEMKILSINKQRKEGRLGINCSMKGGITVGRSGLIDGWTGYTG